MAAIHRSSLTFGSPPGVAQPDPQFGPHLGGADVNGEHLGVECHPQGVEPRARDAVAGCEDAGLQPAMVMTLTTASSGRSSRAMVRPARRRSRRSCRGALVSESSSPQVAEEIVRRASEIHAMSAASAASGRCSIERGEHLVLGHSGSALTADAVQLCHGAPVDRHGVDLAPSHTVKDGGGGGCAGPAKQWSACA